MPNKLKKISGIGLLLLVAFSSFFFVYKKVNTFGARTAEGGAAQPFVTLDVTATSTLGVPVIITGSSSQAFLIEDAEGNDTFWFDTITNTLKFASVDGTQTANVYYLNDPGDADHNDLYIENTSGRDIHLIGSSGENQIFIQDRIVREGDINTYLEFGSDSYQFVAGGVNYVRFEEVGGQDIAEFNWNDEDVDYLMHSDNGSDILWLEAGANGGRGALHRLSLDSDVHDGLIIIENTTTTLNTNTTTLVTLPIEDGDVYHIRAIANAVQQNDTNFASYEFRATVYRSGASATLLNDLNTKVHAEETVGAIDWDAFVDVSGTDAVFQVKGVNSTTWSGFFEYTNGSATST